MLEVQKITDCISDVLKLLSEEVVALGEEEPLAEYGMDSISFIQLVVLLEEVLEIEIFDSDLLVENFSSKKRISETLEKYLLR